DYPTPSHSNQIFLDNDYIYIANGSTLLILRFTQTGIEQIAEIPMQFSLSSNYPNPFNAVTTIQYSLPTSSEVTLDIYDVLGRKVQTIHNGNQPAGSHSLIWNADGFSSGMYFYKITAGENIQTEMMTLIK
ncbi:MAG: T9SS type A sorting domain-containing protein, partial [candidate division Zixibacteria bacterium]|nr:T9SS type A sorting domain-containing protein [candidate division Zixibacteria bacterium]